MTSLFRDWPVTLQPLPRTVCPVQDETASSFVNRLAAANALNGYELELFLRGRKNKPVPVDSLAALSGQPAAVLRYAVLELCTSHELATMKVAGRPRPGGISAAKCGHCVLARGIGPKGRVSCWRRSEDVVCHRHRRWIGGRTELDLTDQSDIVLANRLHQKLIRRHGRRPVFYAFNQASDIIEEWTDRGKHRGGYERRMELFLGPRRIIDRDHPARFAAQYPEIVALTRLLSSPHWRHLALRDAAGNDVFVSEVRRTVVPGYYWDPSSYYRYVDPLVRFFREEIEYSSYRNRWSRDHPIDTIEYASRAL